MNRIALIFFTAFFFAVTASCGGDSGNGSSRTVVPLFAGTVSISSGIAEQVVTFKNPAGELFTAAINDRGGFTLPSASQDDRYLMRIDLGNSNYLYSIAHLPLVNGNRQNIHSYTDLVARTWFADLGLDINSVFASGAGIDNFPGADEIATIAANIQAIVSDVLEVYGLTDVTLSSADYEATDTGIDRFLNENPVIIKNNRATIIVNDPQTNMQSIAVNRVALQTTFGETDTTPPQQPQGLRALGASLTEVSLAWSIASDNIGIATYNVYRDDTLISHTPFPVYRDSGLVPDTEYSYTIVAEDEAGNSSSPSVAAIGRVLDTPDTDAPDVPSSASIDATTQSIDVFWRHSNINDLVRFEVTRTGDGVITREVTSTRFNDITVASGTEYCYTIVAVDASGNLSEPNPSACITTSGATIDAAPEAVTLATIEMAQSSITSNEGSIVTAYVNRLGDSEGEISIDYIVTAGTATADEDYTATDGTLVWADGDIVAKRIDVQLLTDGIEEDNETLSISLTNSSVNAVVTDATTTVIISDN